jgi:[histone H3]-lysine36 N-dimethyltransferase SETMAR
MDGKAEQRVCVKFCVKLGKSFVETFQMLQDAFGDEVMSRSRCHEWFKRFKEGRTSTTDDPRSGRPSTSTDDAQVAKVNALVRSNRRLTIREMAEECHISFGSCQEILTEKLEMRRVAAKFVPRLMSEDQKAHRLEVCQELLEMASSDENFLKSIITGDESWVYGYDVETKVQSSQWKSKISPRPKKARQVRSKVKVMLTVFFDSKGVIHHEFLPQGETINRFRYLDTLRTLRQKIRQKRPELWATAKWVFHHDNAPCHNALLIRDFLVKNDMTTLPPPIHLIWPPATSGCSPS